MTQRTKLEQEVLWLMQSAEVARALSLNCTKFGQTESAQFHAGRAEGYQDAAIRIGNILGVIAVKATNQQTGEKDSVWMIQWVCK